MTKALKHQEFRQNRLKQLRAFCYAAQASSMSKAAERMHLSQPSVSLQVRALERELGVVLFERKGPRIGLTPDGQALYELATPLVEGMDNLMDAFAERRGDVASGELSIAAGESTILYILPRFVERFRARYPGVSLRLHNVTGLDGMALLRADEVDFAVGSMLDFPQDLSFQPIFEYETVLITATDHALADRAEVTLEDVSPYGLILPPRHLSTWRVVDLVFQQHNVPYSVTLEAGGWEIIKKYVELGVGVSIVSSICLTGSEALAVKPLGAFFPPRAYGVVLRRGRFLSPAAKRFIRMMDPSFFASHAGPDPGSIATRRLG
ncbi:MAG: LysR family transcriptional regulator [Gammaproteobacteria bacterium]